MDSRCWRRPARARPCFAASSSVFSDMSEKTEEEAAKHGRARAGRLQHLESIDTLCVPDLHWAVWHRFRQLEGDTFTNTRLSGQQLGVAQQDILFRLDRSGAELKSEAKVSETGVPTDFLLDRPFLIYLKQRTAASPYFAMWVANAELLRGRREQP